MNKITPDSSGESFESLIAEGLSLLEEFQRIGIPVADITMRDIDKKTVNTIDEILAETRDRCFALGMFSGKKHSKEEKNSVHDDIPNINTKLI